MRARAAPGRGSVRAADRRALTADALPPVLLVVGLVFAALAPLRLVEEPGRPGVVLAVVTGSLSAVFLVFRAACCVPTVRAWVVEHAHEVGLALCVLGSLDSFLGVLVTGRPDAGGAVVLYLLIVGTLTYERRYAAFLVALCLVEWLAAAGVHGFEGDWADLSVMVPCAVVVALVLNAAQCRTADRLVRAQQAVLQAATTDELTGLANRRGLLAAGRRLLRPDAGTVDLNVLFLDVDGLQRANDRYGHAAGDQLLVATAGALRSAVRPEDTVARLGGDEFAVLLDDAPSRYVAEVRDRVQQALELAGVAASTGMVTARPGQAVEELLDQADAAMYRVKQQRRARAPQQRSGAGPVGQAPSRARQDPPATDGRGDARAEAVSDLRLVAMGVGLVHVCFVPLHLLLLSPSAARTTTGSSAVVLGCVVLLLRATTSPRALPGVERHVRTLLALVMLLVGATDVLYVATVREAWSTTAVLLGIVATGALLERRAAVVVVLATVLGWAAVAPGHGFATGWSPYAVDVGSAVAVAGLLHAAHAGTLRRLVGTLRHLRRIALTDELTGLANRRGFLAAGRPAMEHSRLRGKGAAVLFLDLDGLKQVNDSQGHAAGDRLIVSAAGALLGATSEGDLCARLGGDEFTVLLPDCRPEDVTERSRRLVAAFEQLRVPVSIGAAHVGSDPVSLEGLVDRADGEMYLVKERRRAAREPLAP